MEIELTAYDLALWRVGCLYLMEFEGQLQQQDLTSGLQQALQEYPIFAGSITQTNPGRYVLCCPQPGTQVPLIDGSSNGSNGSYPFSYLQREVRPRMDTYFRFWRSGAEPPTHGLLSSARATYYRDCDRTLLVFFWAHPLCDFDGVMAFLTHWLRASASVSVDADADARACSDVDAQVKIAKQSVCVCAKQQAEERSACRFERVMYYSRPSGLVPKADVAACRQGCTKPCWPPTEASTAEGSSIGSGSSSVQQACQEWLANHSCPFPWDPLDDISRCKNAWKLLWVTLTSRSHFGVWHLPRDVVVCWKLEAAAARPLPPGLHYSSAIVVAALLAATLYLTDRARYHQQGGLHVNFVVNCRGGRAGMDIPRATLGNASVWGARVWVPAPLLDAAAGRPTPGLMYHLRTGLDAVLTDPQGTLHKQWAWLDAARGAGLSGALHIGQHQQQLEGDITLDYLPCGGDSLPTIQGHKLCYSLCRWPAVGIPGTFTAEPAMAAAYSSSSNSGAPFSSASSSSGGCPAGKRSGFGVRLEGTLPADAAAKAAILWEGLGLQNLNTAAAAGGREGAPPAESLYLMEAAGTVWTVFEFMLTPHSLAKSLFDLFAYLPQTLWTLIPYVRFWQP